MAFRLMKVTNCGSVCNHHVKPLIGFNVLLHYISFPYLRSEKNIFLQYESDTN